MTILSQPQCSTCELQFRFLGLCADSTGSFMGAPVWSVIEITVPKQMQVRGRLVIGALGSMDAVRRQLEQAAHGRAASPTGCSAPLTIRQARGRG